MARLIRKDEPLPCDIYYQSEIWQYIPGYPEYQVSCYGNVRSLKNGKITLLKAGVDYKGYPRVYFSNNSRKKTLTIHRLVAITFLPNPQNMPAVNHKDYDKAFNHVKNLEWTTVRENNTHYFLEQPTSAWPTGVIFDSRRPRNPYVAAIKLNGKKHHLGSFSSAIDAGAAYQQALNNNQIINKYAKN